MVYILYQLYGSMLLWQLNPSLKETLPCWFDNNKQTWNVYFMKKFPMQRTIIYNAPLTVIWHPYNIASGRQSFGIILITSTVTNHRGKINTQTSKSREKIIVNLFHNSGL